uniref:Reverse transcriptase zinc-binding domain-containing protein n=1 Tax=Lactuca sativa TaxID=4236 RepID=A0A9R1WKB8_LACSA|nr:hypothetical protein LSAT_V11C100047040 [Lactuca sativa]
MANWQGKPLIICLNGHCQVLSAMWSLLLMLFKGWELTSLPLSLTKSVKETSLYFGSIGVGILPLVFLSFFSLTSVNFVLFLTRSPYMVLSGFPAEQQELDQLSGWLDNFTLATGLYEWTFNLSSDGNFHAHYFRHFIDSKIMIHTPYPVVWIQLIPIKVSLFMWIVSLDRIPRTMTLSRRGVRINSSSCQLCSSGGGRKEEIILEARSLKEGIDLSFS